MVVRHHSWHNAVIGAAACAVALSGCGTAAAPGSGASSSGGSTAPAKIALTFTVTNGPGAAPRHWTVRCDPPGGTHPDPAATCSALLRMRMRMKEPFATRPKRMICPMFLVSGRQIVVTGTWFGAQVRRVIIDGGCDLSLFETMDKLLR